MVYMKSGLSALKGRKRIDIEGISLFFQKRSLFTKRLIQDETDDAGKRIPPLTNAARPSPDAGPGLPSPPGKFSRD